MRILVLFAVGAVGLLLVVWLFAGREQEARRPDGAPLPSAQTGPDAPELAVLPPEPESARPRRIEGFPLPASPPVPAEATGTLEIQLKDPVNRDPACTGETVELIRDGARIRDGVFRSGEDLRIGGLAAGRYEVRVPPQGFDEARTSVDLPEGAGTVVCRICVTNKHWVAVVVRDAHDRSVADWAADWGGQTKHFFRGSFRAFLSSTAPVSTDAAPATGGVKIEGQVESAGEGCTPAGCIGIVSRQAGAPAWIGLECLGVFLGWELVDPGARSVTFVLDPARIAAQFAELRFRVLHEETRLPALSAKVALVSDSSKHRREEQMKVQLDRDGVAVLRRIYPEDYELRIEMRAPSVSSEVVHRLVLAPGEHRDLGDILVRSDPPIRIRVVDEQGHDVDGGCVQVGPLLPGTDEDSIYSIHGQPRFWNADRNGVISVPRPSFRAVARGLRMIEGSTQLRMPDTGGARSPNVIVEDGHGSGEALVLVLRGPVRVEIAHDPRLAGAIGVMFDEVGIVVGRKQLEADGSWTIELVPGAYELIVRVDADKEIARTSFTASGERTSVELR